MVTDLRLVENIPDCLADLVLLTVAIHHHLLDVSQLPEVEISLSLEALQGQPQLHQLEAEVVQRDGLVLTGRGGSPHTSNNKLDWRLCGTLVPGLECHTHMLQDWTPRSGESAK